MRANQVEQLKRILQEVKAQLKQDLAEGDLYSQAIEHDDEVLWGAVLGAVSALNWNLDRPARLALQEYILAMISHWHG